MFTRTMRNWYPTMVNIETWLCGPPAAQGQRQQYPSRFLTNLFKSYPDFESDKTLHMFSGSVSFGTTTDIRPETGCDICSPFDSIPRPDAFFGHVLADPPYADYFMADWDDAELPRPIDVLREAARLCEIGGLIGVLHIIVIPGYKDPKWRMPPIERVGLHPVLAGPNNAVRVFNVFRRVEGDDG